jgi:ATP-dependent exoDNAse (exonuclease V) beta subunit
VLRTLRRDASSGPETYEGRPRDPAEDAVQVMTIHGAKGLDFEHVYVVQLHKQTGGSRGAAEVELLPSAEGVQYRLFGWPTPGFAEAEALRAAQARAEQVRLLYVAMTRAKRRLVLSGRWRADGALVPAQQATTFADLASHRLNPAATEDQLRTRRRVRREADTSAQWLALGVDEPGTGAAAAPARAHVVDEARVEAEAAALAELRAAASSRSACRIAASVTAVVGNQDRGWAEEREDGDTGGPLRESALAVGSAVHRILEGLDLARDLPSQVHASGPRIADELAEAVARELLATVRSRLRALLSRIEAGGCLQRLGELADRVVARELPLVLPPAPVDPVVGALVGTADLVYTEEGRLVVVDFKTDELNTEDELAARAAYHRPQLERYAAAIQSALALETLPAMELWFLAADRIIRL